MSFLRFRNGKATIPLLAGLCIRDEMIKVVTVEAMREIEAAADASGISYTRMMQSAGLATGERILDIIKAIDEPVITLLIGSGNNGGDGLVAGYHVADNSKTQVRFYLLNKRSEEDENYYAIQQAGLLITYAEDDHDFRLIRNMVASSHLIVDAIFGIGVRLPLRDTVAKVLRNVHQALRPPQFTYTDVMLINPTTQSFPLQKRPYIIAVDCPSGLQCDTGELDSNTLSADETITYIAGKYGLFTFPGAEAVGELRVTQLKVPDDLPELQSQSDFLIDGQFVKTQLPERTLNSHKGTYGKALIIAGSANYTGAPALSAEACHRSGSGLVTVGAPHSVIRTLASQFNEGTWIYLPHDMGVIGERAVQTVLEEMPNYDALLMGPGLGQEDTTGKFMTGLLQQPTDVLPPTNKRAIGFVDEQAVDDQAETDGTILLPPLVLDADALNLLSKHQNWWKLLPQNTILTPHPAEMGRLAGIDTQDVQANRWEIARAKAQEWNVVLVLKGAHTLIASTEGQVAVSPFKTDALATAGTGDILAGLLVGLRVQGLTAWNSAIVGVYLHGLAGQLAGQAQNSRSVIASDILPMIGSAFDTIEKS